MFTKLREDKGQKAKISTWHLFSWRQSALNSRKKPDLAKADERFHTEVILGAKSICTNMGCKCSSFMSMLVCFNRESILLWKQILVWRIDCQWSQQQPSLRRRCVLCGAGILAWHWYYCMIMSWVVRKTDRRITLQTLDYPAAEGGGCFSYLAYSFLQCIFSIMT